MSLEKLVLMFLASIGAAACVLKTNVAAAPDPTGADPTTRSLVLTWAAYYSDCYDFLLRAMQDTSVYKDPAAGSGGMLAGLASAALSLASGGATGTLGSLLKAGSALLSTVTAPAAVPAPTPATGPIPLTPAK